MAGDIKSMSLFLPAEYDNSDDPEQPSSRAWFWSWRKIRDEFFRRWIGEEMARQQAQRQIQQHDPVDAQTARPADTTRQAQAELEAQDDPVDWARRRRGDMLQQHQPDDLEDDIPDFFGDTAGARGGHGGDDLLETIAIVGLCLVLG